MNEEKRMILEMLKEGKITTEEAEKLLDAIGKGEGDKGNQRASYYQGGKGNKNISLDMILQNISDKLDKLSVKLGGKEGDSFSKTISDIGVEVGSTMGDLGKDLEQTFETIVANVKDFTINTNSKGMETVQSTIATDLSEIENPVLDFKAVNGSINLSGSKDTDKVTLNVVCTYKEKEVEPGDKLFDFYLEDERLIFAPRYSGVSVSLEGIIPDKDYEKIYLQSKNGSLSLKDTNSEVINFETSNGKIALKGVNSEDIDLSTKNSRIELEKTSAEAINAQTSNGKLKLANVECENLDCRTSNSAVEAYSVKSEDLVLKTTNASLVADSIMSEKVILYTTNGKVELTNYDEEITEEIDLQTTNGTIKVDKTPKTRPSRYILETSMGSIEVNKDRLIYSNNTHVNYGMKKIEAESMDYQGNEDEAITFRCATSNGSIKIG